MTESLPIRNNKHMSKAKNNWQLIDWDGNPELKLQCWRKKFGGGHVSVGVGDFDLVVYSYGANSDDSCSCTRKRVDRIISEKEMMDYVDSIGGKRRNDKSLKKLEPYPDK